MFAKLSLIVVSVDAATSVWSENDFKAFRAQLCTDINAIDIAKPLWNSAVAPLKSLKESCKEDTTIGNGTECDQAKAKKFLCTRDTAYANAKQICEWSTDKCAETGLTNGSAENNLTLARAWTTAHCEAINDPSTQLSLPNSCTYRNGLEISQAPEVKTMSSTDDKATAAALFREPHWIGKGMLIEAEAGRVKVTAGGTCTGTLTSWFPNDWVAGVATPLAPSWSTKEGLCTQGGGLPFNMCKNETPTSNVSKCISNMPTAFTTDNCQQPTFEGVCTLEAHSAADLLKKQTDHNKAILEETFPSTYSQLEKDAHHVMDAVIEGHKKGAAAALTGIKTAAAFYSKLDPLPWAAKADWGLEDFKAFQTKVCTEDIQAVTLASEIYKTHMIYGCGLSVLSDKVAGYPCTTESHVTEYLCTQAKGEGHYGQANEICEWKEKKCIIKTANDDKERFTHATAYANALCHYPPIPFLTNAVTSDLEGSAICAMRGMGQAPSVGSFPPVVGIAADWNISAEKLLTLATDTKVEKVGTCSGEFDSFFPSKFIGLLPNFQYSTPAGLCTKKGQLPYNMCKRGSDTKATRCVSNLKDVFTPCTTTTYTNGVCDATSSVVRSFSFLLVAASMVAAAIIA